MEVLEQGGDDNPRRLRLPSWAGRATLAALLAATAVAALPSMGGGATSPTPAQPPMAAPNAPAAAGPQVPSQRPGDPGLATSATILLRTPGAIVVDVDSGARTPVPGNLDWSGSGDTLLLGRTVVTVAGRRSSAGPDRQVYAVRPGGSNAVRLRLASRVLPAAADAVWLVSQSGERRRATLVGVDGTVRRPPRLLPGAVDVSGVAPGGRLGQLVVGSRWPGAPAPLRLWDAATGRVTRTLAEAAIVHSSDRRHVVWTACAAECPLVVTRLADGNTRSLGLLPPGSALAGRLRLSPDGRHWAVLATRQDSARLDLLIGHLPGDRRAGAVSAPLRNLTAPPGQRPRLSYARSGWLFVSTGDRVYAIGPGPHGAVALDTLPHHERIAAS